MKSSITHDKHSFLAGGGEMGALIRAKDWSNTPLGAPDRWPQSLRTVLGLLLNSRFPMFLFWGSDLVCFYNDAYRPSLGKEGRHPTILGLPGETAWPDIWDIIKPLIDQVLADGEATWSEDQLIPIYRNGHMEDVYWTFSYSPVMDESNSIGGVFVTCNETTQKVNSLRQVAKREQDLENIVRERTRDLRQANDALERTNQELASFTYVSSHDLQEPLRKIQAFATLILKKDHASLSDNGKNYFQRMQDAAMRMQQLIEDLLTYSRTNTSEKVFKETNLNDLLKEVKNHFEERIREKNASIEIAPLPILPVIAFQMRQVFTNLFSNSLKFTRQDVPPHIAIGYEITEGQLIHPGVEDAHQRFHHISIRDNGIGFDPEHNLRIFEVFKRLHGRSEYEGTGIGLAICKKIIENHGGFISAEGSPGQHATFHILLPEV